MKKNSLQQKVSVRIEFHKNIDTSPYRVRVGKTNVYLSTQDEATRVKRFAEKLLKASDAKQ